MPRKFPDDFKRDVVKVARRRTVPLEGVAADFDISVSTVKRWMHQADIDEGVKDGLTSAEQAEIVTPITETPHCRSSKFPRLLAGVG